MQLHAVECSSFAINVDRWLWLVAVNVRPKYRGMGVRVFQTRAAIVNSFSGNQLGCHIAMAEMSDKGPMKSRLYDIIDRNHDGKMTEM